MNINDNNMNFVFLCINNSQRMAIYCEFRYMYYLWFYIICVNLLVYINDYNHSARNYNIKLLKCKNTQVPRGHHDKAQ
jgi:hypothetical protein